MEGEHCHCGYYKCRRVYICPFMDNNSITNHQLTCMQVRGTATGVWRGSTATATTASAGTGTGTRAGRHATDTKNSKSLVRGLCYNLSMVPLFQITQEEQPIWRVGSAAQGTIHTCSTVHLSIYLFLFPPPLLFSLFTQLQTSQHGELVPRTLLLNLTSWIIFIKCFIFRQFCHLQNHISVTDHFLYYFRDTKICMTFSLLLQKIINYRCHIFVPVNQIFGHQ